MARPGGGVTKEQTRDYVVTTEVTYKLLHIGYPVTTENNGQYVHDAQLQLLI